MDSESMARRAHITRYFNNDGHMLDVQAPSGRVYKNTTLDEIMLAIGNMMTYYTLYYNGWMD